MKRPNKRMDAIYRFVVDLIAPNRCPFCEMIIPWDKYYCSTCFQELPLCAELCPRCGKQKEFCLCKDDYPVYDACVCVAFYADAAATAVLRMKGTLGDNAVAFAQMLYRKLSSTNDEYDLIIPVPMTQKAQRARGYNQAALMAKRLSMLLNTFYAPNLLIKTRDTQAQKKLGKGERTQNVRDAFAVAGKLDLTGKRVLLVDDVLTTGSTMSECAHVLKSAGAGYVTATAFATTQYKRDGAHARDNAVIG